MPENEIKPKIAAERFQQLQISCESQSELFLNVAYHSVITL